MDADLVVVFGAVEVVWVGASLTAIARFTAGFSAVMGIPVFGCVMFSHECIQVIAISFVNIAFANFTNADGVNVHLNILFLRAFLIDGEDPI